MAGVPSADTMVGAAGDGDLSVQGVGVDAEVSLEAGLRMLGGSAFGGMTTSGAAGEAKPAVAGEATSVRRKSREKLSCRRGVGGAPGIERGPIRDESVKGWNSAVWPRCVGQGADTEGSDREALAVRSVDKKRVRSMRSKRE